MILRRIAGVAMMAVALASAGSGAALLFGSLLLIFTSSDPLGIAPILGTYFAIYGTLLIVGAVPAGWAAVLFFRRRALLVQYQRTRAGRRQVIIEKQAAAESELREHDLVDGIVTEQVRLINARIEMLQNAVQAEQVPE